MAFKYTSHHHKNARAVLGLFIVLLAFGILILFVTYKDNIIASNAFQPFIVLTALALGLLAGLLFLSSQEPTEKSSVKTTRVAKPAKTVKASKKKKRKSR